MESLKLDFQKLGSLKLKKYFELSQESSKVVYDKSSLRLTPIHMVALSVEQVKESLVIKRLIKQKTLLKSTAREFFSVREQCALST